MENRCVFCGVVIPEGRMVCPHCEKELSDEDERGACGLTEEDNP